MIAIVNDQRDATAWRVMMTYLPNDDLNTVETANKQLTFKIPRDLIGQSMFLYFYKHQ